MTREMECEVDFTGRSTEKNDAAAGRIHKYCNGAGFELQDKKSGKELVIVK